jgi:hypothetical protein
LPQSNSVPVGLRELFRKMRITYGKMPQAFGFCDPSDIFRDHAWVIPL